MAAATSRPLAQRQTTLVEPSLSEVPTALWVDMASLRYLLHPAIEVPFRAHRLCLALSASQAPINLVLELPPAHSVQLAPLLLQLALRCVNNALVATIVLLAPLFGLVSIAAVATTVPTALALQHPAPIRCLHLADGALYKFKAPHSSWKQPTASITASGTSRQATAS